MTDRHDFTVYRKRNPRILFHKVSPRQINIHFSPAQCLADAAALKSVCNDLYQRSHGTIKVEVTDVSCGVLAVVYDPKVQSKIGPQEAARRLAKRLCETCPNNKYFRSELCPYYFPSKPTYSARSVHPSHHKARRVLAPRR